MSATRAILFLCFYIIKIASYWNIENTSVKKGLILKMHQLKMTDIENTSVENDWYWKYISWKWLILKIHQLKMTNIENKSVENDWY